MESHMYNAKALGMQYIHFTDHDTRMGKSKKRVNGFDFLRGEMEYEDDNGVKRAWRVEGEAEVGLSHGVLSVLASSEGAYVYFYTSGEQHARTLLSEVTFSLDMECEVPKAGGVMLDITLSQRPPDHKEAHYCYLLGEYSLPLAEHTFVRPMPSADGVHYTLSLSRDIAECAEVGGLDNAFVTFGFRLTKGAKLNLSNFEIAHIYNYEEIAVRQRALADEIGARYGIKPYVTSEVSGAGQHKCVYSSRVPIINYYERGKVTEADAVKHILSHGGIFAYNHPFEASKYKRREFTREEIEEIVAYESKTLAENKVHGAALMEVGFPIGRGKFSLRDYLRLWDNLSRSGVFITGDGDSDSHNSRRSWYNANNFASWIAADEALPFPISEEEFNKAIALGNVYMGDPVLFSAEVEFVSRTAAMGAVVMTDSDQLSVSLRLRGVGAGRKIRLIKNGECVSDALCEAGDYAIDFADKREGGVDFVRAEVYDADGRLIMLTNPIYFVGTDYEGEIPKERLVLMTGENK